MLCIIVGEHLNMEVHLVVAMEHLDLVAKESMIWPTISANSDSDNLNICNARSWSNLSHD